MNKSLRILLALTCTQASYNIGHPPIAPLLVLNNSISDTVVKARMKYAAFNEVIGLIREFTTPLGEPLE